MELILHMAQRLGFLPSSTIVSLLWYELTQAFRQLWQVRFGRVLSVEILNRIPVVLVLDRLINKSFL